MSVTYRLVNGATITLDDSIAGDNGWEAFPCQIMLPGGEQATILGRVDMPKIETRKVLEITEEDVSEPKLLECWTTLAHEAEIVIFKGLVLKNNNGRSHASASAQPVRADARVG